MMEHAICDRIEVSIRRVLGEDFPANFVCDESEGVVLIAGTAKTKDDATTCGVVARTIPGVRSVKNDVKAE